MTIDDLTPTFPDSVRRAAGAVQPRLAIAVIDALVDKVVSGAYPPQSMLPVEPDLCAEFGVSRTVVREALRVLSEKGLVQIRQGHGTTVTTSDRWNLLDPIVLATRIAYDDDLDILDQLVRVRVALEAEMAGAAARRAGPGDIAEMESMIATMAGQLSRTSDYLDSDVLFHELVMQASGNQLGRVIIGSIHHHARESDRYSTVQTRPQIVRSHAEHTQICACIAAGDAAGAAEAMRAHIERSWSRKKRRGRRQG